MDTKKKTKFNKENKSKLIYKYMLTKGFIFHSSVVFIGLIFCLFIYFILFSGVLFNQFKTISNFWKSYFSFMMNPSIVVGLVAGMISFSAYMHDIKNNLPYVEVFLSNKQGQDIKKGFLSVVNTGKGSAYDITATIKASDNVSFPKGHLYKIKNIMDCPLLKDGIPILTPGREVDYFLYQNIEVEDTVRFGDIEIMVEYFDRNGIPFQDKYILSQRGFYSIGFETGNQDIKSISVSLNKISKAIYKR